MDKVKKVLSISLAGVMVGTGLVGCSGSKKSSGTDGEKMVITIANSVAINDNTKVEQYLEQKYNVEIQTLGYSTSYYDKLATLFASKKTPDVMFINDVTNWEPLVAQGVIAPIDLKTVEEAAPDHYKHINEANKHLWDLGTRNNQLYAIPKTMGREYNTVVCWNKAWLDEAGVTEIPKTLDEFEDAFAKIKEKKGTSSISGVGGTYYRQFDWLFGAYGVMPEQWYVEDGKVKNGTVSDKALEGLRKLNDWYNKGYINPEFLTDTQSTLAKRFDQNGVVFNTTNLDNISELTPHGIANRAQLPADIANNMVYGPLPEGADGSRGDWLWGPLSNFVCFGAQLKDDVEKQKVILNMLNDINYDEETALTCQYGFKGESYEFYDESVGKTSGIKQLGSYGIDPNADAELGINFFNLFKCGAWANSSIVEQYQNPDYVKAQEENANWNSYNDALLRANLTSTLQYASTLQNLKITAYAEFISGKRSLDNWQDFVDEYNNAGGAQLQKEAQEYYDSVISK